MTGVTSFATDTATLLLRLAGPLQSWGGPSDYNRRGTRSEPTKSGVVGLLSAAQGRRRTEAITDLVELELGVRVDQPGTLGEDYQTAGDFRGRPLLATAVTGKGVQRFTSPPKHTHPTRRSFLQDAVFVVAVRGPLAVIESLDHAVRNPVFPLALGRRAYVPTGPLVIDIRDGADAVDAVLTELPWQVSTHATELFARRFGRPPTVDLSMTVDDASGPDTVQDVPTSFNSRDRRFTPRTVRHTWVTVPTGFSDPDHQPATHDPFTLLGW